MSSQASADKYYRYFLGGFVALFSLVFLSILFLNQGQFIYSMDDPYIHLALAENIAKGHFGVNLSEYSAPSSSIIWPYLLVPFTLLPGGVYAPLLIGFLSALLSFFILLKMLKEWFPGSNKPVVVLAVFFALATNLMGVVFMGMEHSLQILCSILALYGIFCIEKQNRVPGWLYLVLILGPLVRYENSVISLIAGLYLLSRGYWWQTILAGAVTIVLLASYSLYLHSMDLGYLASSIIVKSTDTYKDPVIRLLKNQLSPGGVLMWIAWFSLLWLVLKRPIKFERLLALLALLALSFHYMAGRFGWFGRYELYIIIPVLIVLIYCHRDYIERAIAKPHKHPLFFLYGLLFLFNYGNILIKTPVSANNIYEQQYQMHRFVSEFYPYPVAVNDLGWVSYQNDEYVLDLWGLASREAFELRKASSSSQWMAELSNKHQVRLAMVYQNEQWLTDRPAQWQLIASMETSRPRMIIGDTEVKFFATDAKYAEELSRALDRFSKTLPAEVRFKLY